MNRVEFNKLLNEKILLLDGGYGTEFFKLGLGDYLGDMLNLKHPEAVLNLQKSYVEAGSDIILTNTFNANPKKLNSLGFGKYFEEINQKGVEIAKKASNGKALVFGDISSSGEFAKPIGNAGFDELTETFFAQASLLKKLGVDGFIIETMSDIKELKIALWAVRQAAPDMPIIVHLTFDETGRCVTGTPVEVFASVFNDLDCDVIGMNCSLGPQGMYKNLKTLGLNTNKFISAEPNAGKPIYDGNVLKYNISPDEFGIYTEDFFALGVNILGGCCGTSPAHIKRLNEIRANYAPKPRQNKLKQYLCSRTERKEIEPFCIIGERINPASRNKFQKQIQEHNYTKIIEEAGSQQKQGATCLDVNLGIEKTLSFDHFEEVMQELDKKSSMPLSLDIQTGKYLVHSLKQCPGRSLINSAKVTPKSIEKKSAYLNKYGGMLILLPMGKSIPETIEERYETAIKGIEEFEKNGISRDRIFVDALVLSLGAGNSPDVTLGVIKKIAEQNIKTTCGLSNLSFGLPNRNLINGAFMAQAVGMGLSSAIVNPGEDFTINSLAGALKLKGLELKASQGFKAENPIIDSIISGNTKKLQEQVEDILQTKTAIDVSQNVLGKAMEEIGTLYAKGKIFLPHLLLASDTAKPVFEYLNSLSDEKAKKLAKILLATVEGDVHDIGKKIVGTVLQSAGFEVIDIGIDIPAEKILVEAKKHKADIVGLSAMMTTTIGRIEDFEKLAKTEGKSFFTIAGGASMNQNLATSFGIDGYSKNAGEVVELCKKLLK